MKTFFLNTIFAMFPLFVGAHSPVIAKDASIEKKVEKTLKRMTLEEKIGQMAELAIDVIQDRSVVGEYRVSEAMLDSVIGKYKVGSILNVPNG